MKKKEFIFRGIRKSANLSRKYSSKAANFSGRVENKANRILNGTDPTVQLKDVVLVEKVLSESLPEVVPIHPALPKAGRKPAVTLLLPSLQSSSFFGGTATALIVAAITAIKTGKQLRIVETLVHGSSKTESLVDFLNSTDIGWSDREVSLENLAGRKYNHYGYLDIHPEDIYIASAWWDAYLLQSLPLPSKFIYLIQDYEPIFYNNSDRYALSESTYHSDKFIPLCNTRLMYDFMKSKQYKSIESGVWFEPAVSRLNKITNSNTNSGKKKIFLYGRPSVDRNLYTAALRALDNIFSNNQLENYEWEIVMAGQDKIPDIQLSSGVIIRNLGKLNMEEYFNLLSSVNIAISPMMAPHPNYPTLEFASAGAVVVTTKYDLKQDLSGYSKNIIMTGLTSESLAEGILKASRLKDSEIRKNFKETTIESDWLKTLNKPIADVLKKVGHS